MNAYQEYFYQLKPSFPSDSYSRLLGGLANCYSGSSVSGSYMMFGPPPSLHEQRMRWLLQIQNVNHVGRMSLFNLLLNS
jgi:hypothetical protein